MIDKGTDDSKSNHLICLQVILSGKDPPPDFTFFIISGKCLVVRDVTLIKNVLPSGKARFTLPPIKVGVLNTERAKANEIKHRRRKIERKLLVIKTLEKGNYFGVEEDLGKTYIVSAGRVRRITNV